MDDIDFSLTVDELSEYALMERRWPLRRELRITGGIGFHFLKFRACDVIAQVLPLRQFNPDAQ